MLAMICPYDAQNMLDGHLVRGFAEEKCIQNNILDLLRASKTFVGVMSDLTKFIEKTLDFHTEGRGKMGRGGGGSHACALAHPSARVERG
jgi:hypothetical protein